MATVLWGASDIFSLTIGIAGVSIGDIALPEDGGYPLELALERVQAAVEAVRAVDIVVTVHELMGGCIEATTRRRPCVVAWCLRKRARRSLLSTAYTATRVPFGQS